MATALRRQVSAYQDSVTEASRVAVACWDSQKSIQEAILMTPGLVAAITAVLDNKSLSTAEERQDWITECEDMLRSMTSIAEAAKTLVANNIGMTGLGELRAAMATIRFALADLLDAGTSETAAVSTEAGISPEDFAVVAQTLP